MRRLILTCGIFSFATPACGQEALPAETQIGLAVQAAPIDMRAEATVQGYDGSGDV